MKYILLLTITALITGNMTLFDFNKNSDLSNWMIVDDVVMGGRSNGQLLLDEKGNAVFTGVVSLENNGGFSSVRYNMAQIEVENYNMVELHLKGDGKNYQFRTKTNNYDRHSYVYNFATNGKWQTIQIPFSEMEPRFRGRQLNMSNYPAKLLEEIAFLIGNKENETFRLEIDKIVLK